MEQNFHWIHWIQGIRRIWEITEAWIGFSIKDLLCYSVSGTVVLSLSFTQEVLGSKSAIFLFDFNSFVAEFAGAFRENPTVSKIWSTTIAIKWGKRTWIQSIHSMRRQIIVEGKDAYLIIILLILTEVVPDHLFHQFQTINIHNPRNCLSTISKYNNTEFWIWVFLK